MARSRRRIYGEYLVLAAQAGDGEALDALVAHWQAPLRRHAAWLTGDAEAAGDAVQEAWLDILRGLGRLQRSEAFPAWAHRIVTRKCAAWIRTRQRDRRVEAGLAAEQACAGASVAAEAGRQAEQRSDVRRVLAALQALPAAQRSAMALYHLEEMSVAEIAIALEIPAGTVKTRLMHARRKIRDTLETDTEGDRHDRQDGV